MASRVKWTLCIATVPQRADKLRRLMALLLPQVEGLPIEILIYYNNFEHTIGYFRQKMMEEARGEYISSIDDDDIIPINFVDEIFPLLDGTAYIGFNVELRDPARSKELLKPRPVYHSLKYGEWLEDDDGYYRGVTHLNPILTHLAREASFPEVENGEDYAWTVGVHNYMKSTGKEYTEHYINKVMYIYDHWGHEPMKEMVIKRITKPRYKSKNVRYHPESTKNGLV